MPNILSEAAVADLLNITIKTLRNKRSLGEGPVFVRPRGSRKILYFAEDVAAYLEAGRMRPGFPANSNITTEHAPKSGRDHSRLVG